MAGNPGRTRGAVALSKEEERRTPALVTRDVHADEFAEGLNVAFHSPKFLRRLSILATAEAGANRVHQNQVTLVEQGVRIVLHPVWRRGQEAVRGKRHPPGTQRAHVQPDRRRSRTAVERKSHRAL